MGPVAQFFEDIREVYKTGEASEHSYRPALKSLFDALSPDDLAAVNEPRRTDVGAPDFSFLRDGVPVGHCEAKDIGLGLTTLKGYSVEQKKRYTKAFPNLLYTNGLEFEFIFEGDRRALVNIGDALLGDLRARVEAFDELEHLLRDFFTERPRTIHSSKKLAEMMAGKSALIKDVMCRALLADLKAKTETPLVEQYGAFKEHLIHDIQAADFADLYAETIAYGLFAARLHDETLETFSRTEALELLPKSNPFLRSLFSYIAGPDLDDRIAWIIDELAKIFLACDLKSIMADFGKLTGQNDPFLHFYETFLAAYNPAKRKARGVWYTPEPVVNFIVRAVDDVLKTEFGLKDGLADTSKVKVKFDTGQHITNKDGTIRKRGGGRAYDEREVHRVQILDPATGTGTFLAEVIKQIAPRIKDVAPGVWSKYVEDELIPRLHGFELLMASYAMCHMKLDMILTELGYKPTGSPPRLSVYLTNSLEEGEPADQTLPFAQWLSKEAKGANTIKRDMPIMCVIGNPPYNIQSGNLALEQVSLVSPYRSVDGYPIKEKGMLQFEKNINNDYIKFIALAENMITSNGYGVMGMITSHGYLKSKSFRGLRSHLLETFHKVYVFDLHGNSEIREMAPDGEGDQNVFDIKQGVAILIGVRLKSPNKKGRAYFSELWGRRSDKYLALRSTSHREIDWHDCKATAPNYTFHPSGAAFDRYADGFPSLAEWMPQYSSGVITARDGFSIDEDEGVLIERARQFAESQAQSDAEFCRELGISEKKGWDIGRARRRLAGCNDIAGLIKPISYRPFDDRKVIFDESVVWTTARSTMDHMLAGPNFSLVSARSEKSGTCSHFYMSDKLVETKCGERTTQSAVFPLYMYPASDEFDQTRKVNFAPKLYAKIKELATHPEHGEPDEVAVFDYIYGVLHSPNYREAFAEFLKIDFPRIPWPASPDVFWHVREKGEALRRLHLMEDAAIGETPYPFNGEGDLVVDKPEFVATKDGLGEVWINKTQRFANVPEISWDFFIGGYQPARKWLKDRKGRTLSFDDIRHYQKIIKILAETDRIMGEIQLPLGVEGSKPEATTDAQQSAL